MLRRMALCIALGVLTLGVAACDRGNRSVHTTNVSTDSETPAVVADIGGDLYPRVAPPEQKNTTRPGQVAVDPVVVGDCQLAVIQKQDVPSQRDGIILFIGTEISADERKDVPADELITVKNGTEEKYYRQLKEGDTVQAHQVLALVDDQIPRDEVAISEAKVVAAKADEQTSIKTRDEAKVRWNRQEKLRLQGATSAEEADAARLTYFKYVYEVDSKAAAITLAERERNKAMTTLGMYAIRSAIPGKIKAIYRRKGEAVKSAPSYEPIVQIQNISRLRAEGMIEKQYLSRLRSGKVKVVVEAAESESPQQTLMGHLQEITGVAVSKDSRQIVSASADGTVRVWDRMSRSEQRVLRHPGAVHALACTSPGSEANLCLSGTTDGKLYLWDLDSQGTEPVRIINEGHRRSVTCVAFTPDGKQFASGGDDLEICLWDTDSGKLRYRFPASHRAGLTSLQFTPQAQLVSCGRDNTLRLWSVGTKGARLETTFDRRSGDVAMLGVNPDGTQVLYDQGKSLRLLSLPDGLTRGVLQNSSGAANFTTFALFSPDRPAGKGGNTGQRLILTAGAADGRLQLWKAPALGSRASELRQLVAVERSPATCATFSPDGSFIVTGTRDRQVLVWAVPTEEEVQREMTADLTLIEQSAESEARKVRIWAELKNPDDRLLPGDTVTLVLYPRD